MMRSFRASRRGANNMGYALIVALIATAGLLAVTMTGESVRTLLFAVGDKLSNGATNTAGAAPGSGGQAADTTPDVFAFTPLGAAPLDEDVVSDIIPILGFTSPAAIAVSGDPTARYRLCADDACAAAPPFTADPGLIQPGQYAQLLLRSPVAGGTQTVATLTIDGVSGAWTVDTQVLDTEPDPFDFQTANDVAPDSDQPSEILQITGIDAPAPVSITGDASAAFRTCADPDCSADPAFDSAPATIDPGHYLQLRLHSAPDAGVQAVATVDVGGITDEWTVISGQPDLYPDYMYFPQVDNAALETTIDSAILQVLGINMPAAVSVTGAQNSQYRICADSICSDEPAFVSTPGTIQPEAYIQLRTVSSSSQGDWRTVSLIIGDGNFDWQVMTSYPDSTPDGLSFADVTNAPRSQQPGPDNDYNGEAYVILSEIKQITGIDGTVTMSTMSWDDFGLDGFRICNDATCSDNPSFTTWASSISNGQYVQLRASSPYYRGASKSLPLEVYGDYGGSYYYWNISTEPYSTTIAFDDTANPKTGLNINGSSPGPCYNLTVRNTGSVATSSLASSVYGAFQKGSCTDTCSGGALQPGATCSIGFQPLADYNRSYTGSISVSPTDPNTAGGINKNLAGTATGLACDNPIPGCPAATQTSCGGFIANTASVSVPHMICEGSMVYGTATVTGASYIYQSQIYGNATVSGNAYLNSNIQVYGNASIRDNAYTFINVQIYGNAQVYDSADVMFTSRIYDSAKVYGNAYVNNGNVFGTAELFGNAYLNGGSRSSGTCSSGSC